MGLLACKWLFASKAHVFDYAFDVLTPHFAYWPDFTDTRSLTRLGPSESQTSFSLFPKITETTG